MGIHANCVPAGGNPDWEDRPDMETDKNDSLLLTQYLADAYCPHEISVWTGGGLSSLNYRPHIGKANRGTGGALGIGYTYFLNKNWGLSSGLEYAFYRRTISVNGVDNSHASLDADGNPIIYRSYIDRYEERQRMGLLNIPFSVLYRAGKDGRYYASLGFKAGVPVCGSYTGSGGTLTTSGYYTDYGQEEIWQNDLGYGSFPIQTREKPLRLNLSYAGTLEAGMKWSIGAGTDLYTGFYMDYGLNDMVKGRGKNRFVEYNYENPSEPQINGLLTSLHTHSGNSLAFTEKAASLAAGIKLKLAFSAGCSDLLAERRRYRDIQASGYWENEVYDFSPPAESATDVTTGTNKEEAADNAESDTILSSQSGIIITDATVKITGTEVREAELSEYPYDSGLPPATPAERYKVGQVAIIPEQQLTLDEYAGLLLENPQAHIEITGHTCNLGTDRVNLRIGLKRADLAKDYLVKKGIAPSRIQTFSEGESKPLFPNSSEENRRKNRRIEIKLNK
jgi:outer membrane protein OmpA-like peptidoglycan-associated protein